MNSFIAGQEGNLAIVDGRIGREIEDGLRKLGLELIKTRKLKSVRESISYHPDIVLHPVSQKKIVVEPSEYEYYRQALAPYKIEVIKGSSYLDYKYPADIAYNVGRIGSHAFHRKDSTDPVLLRELEREGIELVDIKQGYSKCSLGLLGKNLAISSDRPMYEKILKLGYRALLIDQGHIDLPGENYGFIGGSMGNLDEDRVLFSGSIEGHKNSLEIEAFLEEESKQPIYLSQEKIIDIGSIIVFNV